MGADSLAENTQNAPKIFGPICLPKPKKLGFAKKSSDWVSVVCDTKYAVPTFMHNYLVPTFLNKIRERLASCFTNKDLNLVKVS